MIAKDMNIEVSNAMLGNFREGEKMVGALEKAWQRRSLYREKYSRSLSHHHSSHLLKS